MTVEQSVCAYCGGIATTMDHVVARALLVNRDKPLTVPACQSCNRSKSLDDDYLRDMFAIRIETAGLPEMQEKQEKMTRSALRGERKSPGKVILQTMKKVPIVQPGGKIVLWQNAVVADSARIRQGLYWIVRGLHFYHMNAVLPSQYEYKWFAYSGNENKEKFDLLWPTAYSGPYGVGDCLVYKVNVCREVPEFSQWLLAFYDRLFFMFSISEDLLLQKGACIEIAPE